MTQFMTPRTDTDWLIYADWLDDHGEDGQSVRSEVADESRRWNYEYRGGGVGVVVVGVGGVGVD